MNIRVYHISKFRQAKRGREITLIAGRSHIVMEDSSLFGIVNGKEGILLTINPEHEPIPFIIVDAAFDIDGNVTKWLLKPTRTSDEIPHRMIIMNL